MYMMADIVDYQDFTITVYLTIYAEVASRQFNLRIVNPCQYSSIIKPDYIVDITYYISSP